jgi:hypothetical protein
MNLTDVNSWLSNAGTAIDGAGPLTVPYAAGMVSQLAAGTRDYLLVTATSTSDTHYVIARKSPGYVLVSVQCLYTPLPTDPAALRRHAALQHALIVIRPSLPGPLIQSLTVARAAYLRYLSAAATPPFLPSRERSLLASRLLVAQCHLQNP